METTHTICGYLLTRTREGAESRAQDDPIELATGSAEGAAIFSHSAIFSNSLGRAQPHASDPGFTPDGGPLPQEPLLYTARHACDRHEP